MRQTSISNYKSNSIDLTLSDDFASNAMAVKCFFFSRIQSKLAAGSGSCSAKYDLDSTLPKMTLKPSSLQFSFRLDLDYAGAIQRCFGKFDS